MKFKKNIKLEEQQMLKNSLANYEQEKSMTPKEKKNYVSGLEMAMILIAMDMAIALKTVI